uniref:DUF4160 domain-containing protein n=1 Tax=Candidatus Kentrum sp. LPFa TaxID=2126335 RepID=A0A450WHS0_9GAMM|nr:MAG: protein of unknown function (DUF4160) [Candidatus Kentron sp. LPFa]
MPTISMFYGILISIYFYDDGKHNLPHIRAEYGEHEASIAIDDGAVLSPFSESIRCAEGELSWIGF